MDMENNKAIIEQIDQYLLGELSTDEQAKFEIELANSTEIQQALEEQKLLHQAVRKEQKIALKKKMQAIHNDLGVNEEGTYVATGTHYMINEPTIGYNKKYKQKKKRSNFLLIAASFVGLLAVVGVVFTMFLNSGNNTNALAYETTVQQIGTGGLGYAGNVEKVNITISESKENTYSFDGKNLSLQTNLLAKEVKPLVLQVNQLNFKGTYIALNNNFYRIEQGEKNGLKVEKNRAILRLLNSEAL